MGLPTMAYFQEWMVYFVEQILHEKEDILFYWGGIISDCFHEQFMAMEKTSKFYMTSYLVYSFAKQRQYGGLFRAPNEEQGRELKVYDRYPQLQYRNYKKHYYRFNDTFRGHIIKLIRGDFER